MPDDEFSLETLLAATKLLSAQITNALIEKFPEAGWRYDPERVGGAVLDVEHGMELTVVVQLNAIKVTHGPRGADGFDAWWEFDDVASTMMALQLWDGTRPGTDWMRSSEDVRDG